MPPSTSIWIASLGAVILPEVRSRKWHQWKNQPHNFHFASMARRTREQLALEDEFALADDDTLELPARQIKRVLLRSFEEV